MLCRTGICVAVDTEHCHLTLKQEGIVLATADATGDDFSSVTQC
jgi:hypothetical protein